MNIHLSQNYKQILKNAWSVKFLIGSMVLHGVDVFLSNLDGTIVNGEVFIIPVFVKSSLTISETICDLLALISRVIHQETLNGPLQ